MLDCHTKIDGLAWERDANIGASLVARIAFHVTTICQSPLRSLPGVTSDEANNVIWLLYGYFIAFLHSSKNSSCLAVCFVASRVI